MSEKVVLTDLTFHGLEDFLASLGEPKYRARQIWRWLYQALATDFSEMTDLPLPLRRRLASVAAIGSLKAVTEQRSKDGLTRKVLFELCDGRTIESVLMLYEDRRTVCVSSQVGCALGCVFCATGHAGLVRQLRPGEIVEQVLHFARLLRDSGQEITNVVFMGMGEPFANFEGLKRAVEILHDPEGFNLGARRMTVSTAGLVPQIRLFAGWDMPVGLAVSLHAPTDDLRNRLVPINRKYPLRELIEAVRYYIQRTNRQVTFEYAMINGINDGLREARQLARLLKGLLAHVNLIPLNPVEGSPFRPSSKERILAFQAELNRVGISSSLRIERGVDIQAACGQLRQAIQGKKARLDVGGQRKGDAA